ncbi:hypothetical protein Hypma_011205 [Hypsizygus marmoreus]|uniref:RNase H type-1 domain-containing protein n=1 Tax=Hypsizygus marmoreus TaxID=39966 RepID=A0A369JK57_HYPMA|nr:hypothetical protein Hypma_011205 [Hypsizygus marmoreus]
MTNEIPQPPPPGPLWTCDPVFGLVHTSECRTCLVYMRHVAAAGHVEDDLSFKDAVKERDSKNTFCFLTGMYEGGRLQQAHDADSGLIQTYRRERDEARDEASRRVAELLTVTEELLQVKEQLHALHALFNEMADSAANEQFLWADQAVPLSVSESFSESPLSTGDGDAQYGMHQVDLSPLAPTHSLPSPVPSPKAYYPSPPASPERVPAVKPLPPSRPQTTDPTATTFLQATASYGGADYLANDPTPSICQDEPPPPVSVSATGSNSITADPISPESIEQLKIWMEEGRTPGNTEALARVKALCTRAQLTPSSQRTELQRYLLSEWKGPVLPYPTNEIFVDSSAWGIGFVMNGRWLAWKLKPEWKKEGRDNNWSEMVAVELGLRVAISAGFHSSHLTIRSDNTGVVQALKTGKSKHSAQTEILKKIIQLGNMYNIVLKPVWVSTKDNVADKPSRGVFSPRALLYPVSPSIPSHLAQFLHSSVELQSVAR